MEQLSFIEERKYILISLKPEYYQWMIDGYKRFEYRSRFPDIKTFAFIYVTRPIGAIKACIDFDKPVKDHNALIGKSGQGVADFIAGRKGNKMAIPINKIYELKHNIPLSVMRQYGVSAPQSYIYIKKENPFFDLLNAEVEVEL